MIIQRHGYFEKCLTPKKSLEFQRLMTVNQCFLSTRRFERKNRYGDMYQIEKDGVMCGKSITWWFDYQTEPVELGIKLKDTYHPENFSSEPFGFWEKRGYSNTAEPWLNDRYS